jgi:hypothetical protein
MDDVKGVGKWGWGTGMPLSYDRFLENAKGQNLVKSFPNNSAALAAQLTSNGVYFNGPQTRAANGGRGARLYAPSPWSGSSISHLDEATYPAGNPNSLMTPQLNSGESIHDPGSIGLAVLRDQGW